MEVAAAGAAGTVILGGNFNSKPASGTSHAVVTAPPLCFWALSNFGLFVPATAAGALSYVVPLLQQKMTQVLR